MSLFAVLTCLVSVASLLSSVATTDDTQQQQQQQQQTIERIVADVEKSLSCRHVPGMAMSVVLDGRVMMLRGFGSARLAGPGVTGRRVNQTTKFVIASLSKAFTATLVGILLKEHEDRFPRRWYTKVKDIMGHDFRFSDELRTNHVTVRDVLAHRTGVPGYQIAMMVGLEPKHSRQDYCSRMQFMELDETTSSFRSKFEYSNIMYLLAGCLVEKLGPPGQTLEQLMAEKLFRPLGMNSTHFVSELSDNDEQLATMYYWNTTSNQHTPVDTRIIRTVQPLDSAGGIVSTINDMSRWMQFQLRYGKDESGRELIPLQYWKEMHSAHVAIVRPPIPVVRPWFPVTDMFTAYGLGWRLGVYRGLSKSEHAGRLAGYESKLTLIHSAKLGVFTTNNGPLWGGKDLHVVLHFQIIDEILKSLALSGNISSWLNASTACSFPEPWASQLPVEIQVPRPLVADPSPTEPEHPPAGWLVDAHRLYVGSYGHKLLGNFTVSFAASSDNVDGGQLTFHTGLIGEGRLIYTDGVTWLLAFDDLVYFGRFSKFRDTPLPILFHDQGPDERFRAVAVFPFEPRAPPVFRRGVRWDLASSSSTAGFSVSVSNHVFKLIFALILIHLSS